ncbi:hypothetical protein OPV22_028974 [Ensete ventricosum]|uniref:Uncharacterized protein n=1 Tax=Ensete ventricosum TaxID=4639 RepID=A0AAV8P6V0_ENSVE|nr:hypothetical protein OPV22_028974 [Ensete ventricosum]
MAASVGIATVIRLRIEHDNLAGAEWVAHLYMRLEILQGLFSSYTPNPRKSISANVQAEDCGRKIPLMTIIDLSPVTGWMPYKVHCSSSFNATPVATIVWSLI